MDSLTQRNEEERLAKEKKKHKITMALAVTFITIAAIAIFLYIVNGIINRTYTAYEVINTVKKQDSNSVEYQSHQGKILKFSRDGASGIAENGDILWNGSYEMNNPAASTCGDYVIIGDIGSKEAYVYNGSNSGILIPETLPITQVEIAGQGVSAVVLEDTASNEIHIYNPFDSGNTLLFTIPSNVKEDGYPVDIDLSTDGKKMVTNYLAVNNGVVQTKIAFYNFGGVGKDKENFIVGGLDMGQELCPEVLFLDNDTVCILGEQGFYLYSMPELPEEIYNEKFKQPVKSVMHNSKYVGFVLEDEKLLIYDLQGKKVLEDKIDFEYDRVSFTENEILFTTDLSCKMIHFNGKLKWEYTFNKSVNQIFPAQKRDRFILIDDVNIEYIKLSEE